MTAKDAPSEASRSRAARRAALAARVPKRFVVHVFEDAEPARPRPGSRDVTVSVSARGSAGVPRLAREAAAALWRSKYHAEMPPKVGAVIIHEEPEPLRGRPLAGGRR